MTMRLCDASVESILEIVRADAAELERRYGPREASFLTVSPDASKLMKGLVIAVNNIQTGPNPCVHLFV
jgi:hypothetical protein